LVEYLSLSLDAIPRIKDIEISLEMEQRKTLRLVQFNVLAEQYDLPAPDFAQRRDKVMETIRSSDPDVIVLEEVQPASWYRTQFEKNFTVIFEPKPQGPRGTATPANEDVTDGTMLLFRRGVVECMEYRRVSFPASSEGQEANQCVALARVCHLPTGRMLYVAGTHMKAGLGDTMDEIRVRHWDSFFAEFKTIRNTFHAPLVLVGDLNENPTARSIRFLEEGTTTCQTGVVEHDLVLHNAYKVANGGMNPRFTICDRGFTAILDYVFYEAGHFSVLSFEKVPELARGTVNAIEVSGSDHLPLKFEFQLEFPFQK